MASFLLLTRDHDGHFGSRPISCELYKKTIPITRAMAHKRDPYESSGGSEAVRGEVLSWGSGVGGYPELSQGSIRQDNLDRESVYLKSEFASFPKLLNKQPAKDWLPTSSLSKHNVVAAFNLMN